MNLLVEWVIKNLGDISNQPRIVIRDPLQIIQSREKGIEEFADNNGYIVIFAATNLVFRELYQHALDDPIKKKILLIDQTPQGRINKTTGKHTPPLFYPDFLKDTREEAQITIDLQKFLEQQTGDTSWPIEVNDRRYAKLALKHIEGILQAHQNLRIANKTRFTDRDFRTIIAFATLGVADQAFKKLDTKSYWKICLLNHEELKNLYDLTPDVMQVIKENLINAPKPFCWFADQDPEKVIRGLYLTIVLSQHGDGWKKLLPLIDPEARQFIDVPQDILNDAVLNLINSDPDKAEFDFTEFENNISRETLKALLIDQWKIYEPKHWLSIIKAEGYSTLIRSLALLVALEDLLTEDPAISEQKELFSFIYDNQPAEQSRFIDRRESKCWSTIREVYSLAYQVRKIQIDTKAILKEIEVFRYEELNFTIFWDIWNNKQLNRLEYMSSAISRILDYGSDTLLPRAKEDLPEDFFQSLTHVQQKVRDISENISDSLLQVNLRYQEMVARDYPTWIENESNVVLTSQFISRVLKPNWDPQNEDAVIFIFDGMRYDIWDELLRPLLIERMDIISEHPASSLLPSETSISRKAISAGTFADSFDMSAAENLLLKESLMRDFGYHGDVVKVEPEGFGTGQTVRYRTDNLDVYIFELCDKGLHHIRTKEVGGCDIPERPLALIYQQLQDIFEHEVMAIIRKLKPGTKVFITSDHGFGQVGKEKIWFHHTELNDARDCAYLHCALNTRLVSSSVPDYLKKKIIEFSPDQIRMPKEEHYVERKTQNLVHKTFESYVFPAVGYAFSKPGSPFNPDAFSHGGISMPEMMIPMIVLKVKPHVSGLISLDLLSGTSEFNEGDEIVFQFSIHNHGKSTLTGSEIRVDLEASYSDQQDSKQLSAKVLYVPAWEKKPFWYRFTIDPNEASTEERKAGIMTRRFSLTAKYKEGNRIARKFYSKDFVVKLNPDRIVRRIGNLGNILGLTPKGALKNLDMR